MLNWRSLRPPETIQGPALSGGETPENSCSARRRVSPWADWGLSMNLRHFSKRSLTAGLSEGRPARPSRDGPLGPNFPRPTSGGEGHAITSCQIKSYGVVPGRDGLCELHRGGGFYQPPPAMTRAMCIRSGEDRGQWLAAVEDAWRKSRRADMMGVLERLRSHFAGHRHPEEVRKWRAKRLASWA